jgi:osmotically-inducible protein OsmY
VTLVGADDGLTGTRDDLLVVALARGDTYQAAGQVAGVSESTMRRRMADEVFRRRVSPGAWRAGRFRVRSGVRGAVGAIVTLVRLLGCANDSVALGAARSLVDCAMRLRGQGELEERLLEVEVVLAAVTAGRGLRAV